MNTIQIAAAGLSLSAELYETPTARRIWEALPFDGYANTWGDEIYFPLSLRLEQEADAREELEVGELGFWIPGQMFCIFLGPTPASMGEQPCAASPVNVFGRVTSDVDLLRHIRDGEPISISRE